MAKRSKETSEKIKKSQSDKSKGTIKTQIGGAVGGSSFIKKNITHYPQK